MPKEMFGKDYQFLEHLSLLTFEEIDSRSRAYSKHSASRKSASPAANRLVRRNLEQLIEMLAKFPGSI